MEGACRAELRLNKQAATVMADSNRIRHLSVKQIFLQHTFLYERLTSLLWN